MQEAVVGEASECNLQPINMHTDTQEGTYRHTQTRIWIHTVSTFVGEKVLHCLLTENTEVIIAI